MEPFQKGDDGNNINFNKKNLPRKLKLKGSAFLFFDPTL